MLKKFIKGVFDVPAPRAAIAGAPAVLADDGAVQVAAVQAQDAVPGITTELKLKTKTEVDEWIEGEQTIYAVIVKSLVNASELKCETEGAGRKQLEELQDYWHANTSKTTLALDDSKTDWTYIKGEGLKAYGKRFQKFLNECKEAKPNPLIFNAEQKWNTYTRGLRRMSMYEMDIKQGWGHKHVTWEAMHEYLIKIEDAAGKQIRRKYGSSKAEVAAADVKSDLCQHYLYTGQCRFGDKCRYEHPGWVKDKLKNLEIKGKFKAKIKGNDKRQGRAGKSRRNKKHKRKEQKCYEYWYTGRCQFGNQCKYKHRKNPNRKHKKKHKKKKKKKRRHLYDSDSTESSDGVRVGEVYAEADSEMFRVVPDYSECCHKGEKCPYKDKINEKYNGKIAAVIGEEVNATDHTCSSHREEVNAADAAKREEVNTVDAAANVHLEEANSESHTSGSIEETEGKIKFNYAYAEFNMLTSMEATESKENEDDVREAIVTAMSFEENTYKDPDERPMMDSGATHGLTNDRSKLINIQKVKFKVRGVVGVRKVTEMGTYVGCKGGTCPGVLLLDTAPRTVLAVRQLRQRFPGDITMGDSAWHQAAGGKKTTLGPVTANGWYRIERLPQNPVRKSGMEMDEAEDADVLNAEEMDYGELADEETQSDEEEEAESDSESDEESDSYGKPPPLVSVSSSSGSDTSDDDTSTSDTGTITSEDDEVPPLVDVSSSSSSESDSSDSYLHEEPKRYVAETSTSKESTSSTSDTTNSSDGTSTTSSDDEPPDLTEHSSSDSESDESEAELYPLEVSAQIKREKVQRLHENLGHASPKIMRLVLATQSLMGLKPKDVDLYQKCEVCASANPKRGSHPLTPQKEEKSFCSHLSADNTGPQPVKSRGGKSVLNVVVDHHTNWKFVEALFSKTESVQRLRYVIMQEGNNKTKKVRTDQGGEYMNYDMGLLMKEANAVHETSASGVSQQNGRAEKAIQDIMGKVRVGLQSLSRGMDLWAEAAKHAAHNLNRMPCYANPDMASPFFMRYGRHPDYRKLQPFGQACTAFFPKKKKKVPGKKLAIRAMPGFLVGYDNQDGTKAYRVLIEQTRTIMITPHCTFFSRIATGGVMPNVHLMQDAEDGRAPDITEPVTVKRPDEKQPAVAAGGVTQPTGGVTQPIPANTEIPANGEVSREFSRELRAASAILNTPTTTPQPVQARPDRVHLGQPAIRQPDFTPATPVKPPPPPPPATATKTPSAGPATANVPDPSPPKTKRAPTPKPRRSPAKVRRESARIKAKRARRPAPKPKSPSKRPPRPPKTEAAPAPRRSARNKQHVPGQYKHSTYYAKNANLEASNRNGGEVYSAKHLSKVPTRLLQAAVYSMACVMDVDADAAIIVEPSNYDDAVNDPDYGVEWLKASKGEEQALRENKVFEEVDIDSLPAGTRIVSGRWVYKVKPAEDGSVAVFKARIVARGNETKKGVHFDDTFAPTANSKSIKLLLAIAVTLGLHLRGADFKTAFLNAVRGEDDKKIYFRPPKGVTIGKGKVWLLLKALYGCKDSPRLWHKMLVKFLKNLGFTQSNGDPCLLFKIGKGEYTIMTLVVDDVLMATKTKQHADDLIKAFKKKFKIKDLGKPAYTIGIHIRYDRQKKQLKLNQELYLKTAGRKYGLHKSRKISTPADRGLQLQQDMGTEDCDEDYRGIIGSLMYMIHTRPDVAAIVSSLARYNDKAQHGHWLAARRVLQYLFHSRGKYLIFNPKISPGKELVVYSDSSWANCPDTSRSRSGYICFFNECAVSWHSSMQKSVALSSCHAEYIALAEAIKEALWLKNLLKELHFPQGPVTVYVDNKGALQLAQHHMLRPRSKFISMRHHWIREKVKSKEVEVVYVPSHLNKADMFTKNLGRVKLTQLLQGILS